jgi:hypothetical protein
MAKGKQALGKGLDILFSGSTPEIQTETASAESTPKEGDSILFIKIENIKTNPYQPREEFEETALQELADSIKQKGVIQAITVRKTGENSYELLSGERRLRASRLAGLEKIPAGNRRSCGVGEAIQGIVLRGTWGRPGPDRVSEGSSGRGSLSFDAANKKILRPAQPVQSRQAH